MHLLSQHPGNAFTNRYAGELIQTAAALVVRGKGILAADESTGTIGKRVLRTAVDTRMYTAEDIQCLKASTESESLALFVAVQHWT